MKTVTRASALAFAMLFISLPAAAHCDSLDGPVIKAAMGALQKGDVTPVLRWVTRDQEGEVRAAFDDTVAVRAGGARARALADRYFFETLVRLHRESEGEPYTGIKPAGGISEHLVAGDRALDAGAVDALADALTRGAAQTLRARFAEALKLRARADDNVEAGRRYVAAYVAFMHYVDELGALGAGDSRGAERVPKR